MPTEPQSVTIPTDDGDMPAHLVAAALGVRAGLLLLQEIFGVSADIRSRSADLAALGYVVLAPEIHWRHAPSPTLSAP